jgi:hydrogenase maturation protein HypF
VENRVAEPVIGVAFDGTGYGADGTIWGGEFLIADWRSYQRAGHLEYIPLPGGSAAIKRPYRIALSLLFTLLGDDCSLEGLPLEKINPNEVKIVRKQLKQGLNSPPTSSAGRLFDAVSALAGVRGEIDYEAQAAIELEMLATDKAHRSGPKAYPFSIVAEDGAKVVKLGGLISSVVADLRDSVPVPVISYRFHLTVAQIIVAMCRDISQESGIKRVALSGGVFQNRLLFGLTTRALSKEGLTILTHHLVPCNDGGISLGQAVIANFAQRS